MAKYGIGQAITRREDERLLLGTGEFVDDIALDDECFVHFVRSPYARANISSIDTAEAEGMPGVVGVLTGEQLVADDVGNLPLNVMAEAAPPNYALAVGTVNYVGEAVAAVIAETRILAEDAAERIMVDFEEIPAVITLEAAMAPDAPQLCDDAKGNITGKTEFGDKVACDRAFADAHHITKIEIYNQRLVPVSMEPRGSIATFDLETGRLTLFTSCQNPAGLQNILATEVLKMPPKNVRVRVGDVGGGFGMKTQLYPEDIVVAYSARKFGRPMHWRATRSEEFLAANHGRDLLNKAEMAFDKQGKILGLKVENVGNVGGHGSGPGAVIAVAVGPKVITGVYHIPELHLTAKAVLTNTNLVGAYRGAGRPEAIFLLERLMSQAAFEMGIDSAELRRRNLLQPAQMPYTTPMGEKFDSGNFPHMLDLILKKADWNGFDARKENSSKKGLLRGRAITTFLEWTGATFEEDIEVEIGGAGRVKVFTALQAMGQGIETSLIQVISDTLGIDADVIDFVQGDSDIGPGMGSMGSRSLYIGGSALYSASKEVIEKGKELAGNALEASVDDIIYEDGKFTVAGTDLDIDIFELAGKQTEQKIIVKTKETVGGPSWPNGCHVAEVEVDPNTGVTEIVRYTTVDDVGRVINPLIVAGQVHGGVAQAVGQALLEDTRYDPESGQLMTGSLLDYCLPRADDLPSFDTYTDESTPCKINPLGAKGVGELGTVGGTPTVINAVLDALRPVGVRDIDMPATSERVWRSIKDAKQKVA